MSHLLQMRGLKQFLNELVEFENGVASFTDAWIETFAPRRLPYRTASHLLQMRGLKHFCLDRKHHRHVASFTDAWIETLSAPYMRKSLTSHLLQMRGLKHKASKEIIDICSRIFYRCVD